MNFSALLGFVITGLVLFFAIFSAEGLQAIVLNKHAVILVIGGTMAAAFISFPIANIVSLSWLAFKKLLGVRSQNYDVIIREVIRIAEASQKDPQAAKSMVGTVKNLFLKEGLQLVIDGATEEQIADILGTRIETFHRRHTNEANMFKTIGKFPPAFGLLGTTLGMIGLLSKLGDEGAQKLIGPAMAVGLVATLYGIGLTNFIFIPIAENLSALNGEDYAARKMILEGLLMIKKKVHPILVEEKMKSYLLPAERSKVTTRSA